MEAPWAQHVRNIRKRQSSEIIGGEIDRNHHLILRRRDNEIKDLGLLKEKPSSKLIFVAGKPGLAPAAPSNFSEPCVYVSEDGAFWTPGQVQGEFRARTKNLDFGCWTGDRFLLSVYDDQRYALIPDLGICAGAVSNAVLYSEALPPTTLRPKVVLFPAGNTVDTEWVVGYAHFTATFTYNLEVRYVSVAGGTIQMGPPLAIPGTNNSSIGDVSVGDNLRGLWGDGHKILIARFLASWVITDPGSLTIAPTVGDNQGNNGDGDLVAECDDGVYVFDWVGRWGGFSGMLKRRPIVGGTIGDIDSSTPFFTPPSGWSGGFPVHGPFGGPYLIPYADSGNNFKYMPLFVDKSANTLTHGTFPSTSVSGPAVSLVHQAHVPSGSVWLLKVSDKIAHLSEDGEVVNVVSVLNTNTAIWEWDGNEFLSVGSSYSIYRISTMNVDGTETSGEHSCATTQEYSFTSNANHARVESKSILIAVGRRLILVNPAPCNTCQTFPVGESLMQSRDGGNWVYHTDIEIFDYTNPNVAVTCIDATETGLVVAVGVFLGPEHNASLVASKNFGDTWEVLPTTTIGTVLNGVYLKNESEWVVTRSGNAYYTYDAGAHWNSIVFPPGWGLSSASLAGTGIRYFNGYWWAFGRGSGTGQWDTPIIKSKDLFNWEPVVTVWSGTYPLFVTYKGGSHNGDSGTIYALEYDPQTNTILVVGFSQTSITGIAPLNIMMSPDGGDHWFEIGSKTKAAWAEAHGFDGVYNWPETWEFYPGPSVRYAHGHWFILNARSMAFNVPVSENTPPIIRLSIDGRRSEAVYPPHQNTRRGYGLLVGG